MIQQSTLAKALEINADPKIYGTFAEIGAGQEVARFFFQAGRASQTIAKTISAYDMVFSDEIYGKESSGRYVCESRLLKMLDKEYKLLRRRLTEERGDRTQFFAFANTVSTGSQGEKMTRQKMTHGWMGIRFQHQPGSEPNDIILHVRLLDKYRLQQQEVLGILGVNLVATAFGKIEQHAQLVESLQANIKEGKLAVDMIRVSGPFLQKINNHLLNLELVKRNLTEAVLFGPDQSILNISDAFFDQSFVIQRGQFRPVTLSHLDLVEKGVRQFKKEFPGTKPPKILFEITMHNLQESGKASGKESGKESEKKEINEKDFLDRVRTLGSLGHYTLVSHFFLFFRLKRFLRQFTAQPMALILGAIHLEKVFDETHYQDLEGGILEGLGKLLDEKTHLYIYPSKDEKSCQTSKTFFPKAQLLKLYQYFTENRFLVDMAECDEIDEFIHSEKVLKLLQKKNSDWKKFVPEKAAQLIQSENLFSKR